MKKLISITVIAILSFAPMAIAFPKTELDIAIIALASNNKQSTADKTYDKLLKLLPNQSADKLKEAAEFVHKARSGSRDESKVQTRRVRTR